MSEFVTIGTVRVNLDNVAYVEKFTGWVEVHYTAVSTEITWSRFDDDEAALLLAILDHDDELVDALYPIVNQPNIPTEPAGIRCMLCGAKR